MADDDRYVNIRDANMLGPVIGARVVDVTQHDKDEFDEDGSCYIALHFDTGHTVRVFIGDGGFEVLGPTGQGDD